MDSKKEQALVGVFVLIVAALLIVTVFIKSGTLDKDNTPYHTYFKNAGGLEPGAEVRYLNGPPIGRVGKVSFDPQDPGRMKVDFSAKPDIPVKTDSVVAITSTSPLGENFLEILAGTSQAPRAPRDATLRAKEPTSFSDIADKINELPPAANELIHNLNDRVTEVKVTLARVNDLLNDQNRENVSASLSHLRGMLQEDRPLGRHLPIQLAGHQLRPARSQGLQLRIAAAGPVPHVDQQRPLGEAPVGVEMLERIARK